VTEHDVSPASDGHWFEALADHMGPAYLRYSFTKGTAQEVSFLVDELGLVSGQRVLDVGCGPGRHSLELAARGIEVVGVDISQRFIELAADAARTERCPATFVRGDARRLEELDLGEPFDAAISLCQGAIGLSDADADPADPCNVVSDRAVLSGMVSRLRSGGRLALSAFSSYFQVAHLVDPNDFNASRGVHHEYTEVRNGDGHALAAELWTTCVTPRELYLQAEQCGLVVDGIWSVAPGAYGRHQPRIDSEEFLLVGHRSP